MCTVISGLKSCAPTTSNINLSGRFIKLWDTCEHLCYFQQSCKIQQTEIRRSCCGNCGGYFNVIYTLGLSAQASSEVEPVAVVVVGATGAVSWGRSMISISAMGALSVMRWPSFTMRV